MNKPPRLLVVGTAGHHYLLGHGRVEAALLPDPYLPGGGAAQEFAARRGIGRILAGWDEAADWAPDAASVGVAYARNGAAAAECLRRGWPTVTDKPAAATRPQLAALRRAARGGVLLTEFDMRRRPAVRSARRAVAAGRVGTPLLATAQKSYVWGERPDWYGDLRLCAGLPLWVLSHAVDLIRHVTGLGVEPASLIVGPPRRRSGMQACCGATFGLSGGGVAVATADYLRPGGHGHADDRLRVAGDAGVIELAAGRCNLLTDGRREVLCEDDGAGDMADALLASLTDPGPHQPYHTADSLAMADLMLTVAEAAEAAGRAG